MSSQVVQENGRSSASARGSPFRSLWLDNAHPLVGLARQINTNYFGNALYFDLARKLDDSRLKGALPRRRGFLPARVRSGLKSPHIQIIFERVSQAMPRKRPAIRL
jgi:hypothetical protein